MSALGHQCATNHGPKGVYERIYGSQKTRTKKAAIALARKLAVIAWAMLRDEKEWEPSKMIEITKSYGHKLPMNEETLRNLPKKQYRHKRKRRLAKQRKAAVHAKASKSSRKSPEAEPISRRNNPAEPTGRTPRRSQNEAITQPPQQPGSEQESQYLAPDAETSA